MPGAERGGGRQHLKLATFRSEGLGVAGLQGSSIEHRDWNVKVKRFKAESSQYTWSACVRVSLRPRQSTNFKCLVGAGGGVRGCIAQTRTEFEMSCSLNS